MGLSCNTCLHGVNAVIGERSHSWDENNRRLTSQGAGREATAPNVEKICQKLSFFRQELIRQRFL